jgi:hypothetical protein
MCPNCLQPVRPCGCGVWGLDAFIESGDPDPPPRQLPGLRKQERR